MAIQVFVSLLLLLSLLQPSSSSSSSLSQGSSLTVENSYDYLISPKGTFSAGFYSIGNNSFLFAIWLTEKMHDGSLTVVWMANRDNPVNGKGSKISLLNDGNLVLTDAGQFNVWATRTSHPDSFVELSLHDSGNIVLQNTKSKKIIWQSFDFPTDTLLANQPLTRHTSLISSRSSTNYSSGFYKLFFDDDNVLRLLFDGLEVSSIYWPKPWLTSYENGRFNNNNSRTAVFNSSGYFKTTDNFNFQPSDYGLRRLRRITMDIDGNLRMHSLDEETNERRWMVTWQAFIQQCTIHGICGPNSLCTYDPGEGKTGRKCICLPGYKIKNKIDWAYGCEKDFSFTCEDNETIDFLELPKVNFFGYDLAYFRNYTIPMCEKECLNRCDCLGFQMNFVRNNENWFYECYIKGLLFNGYRSPGNTEPTYIKLPKKLVNKTPKTDFSLNCSRTDNVTLDRVYKKASDNGTLKFMVWFGITVGGIELLLICVVFCFLYRTHRVFDPKTQGYMEIGFGFKKFTYDEMKKATKNFSEEIGRGGGGVVYKGFLSDHRVAAIKRLNEANHGDADFLAEVSTIGKLNHMNLIEMWGYCVEGKHKILVYEYMERGSLEKNLNSKTLDSEKRFDIAVGTARGLAYLHEECLDWVLHCDVKPQNVLLDANFQPKVADLGLSKLFDRTKGDDSNFSTIRGTRGYMAPEWIYDHGITSKVDVYSYGVVVLEIVTGKGPMEQNGLVNWVKDKMMNECVIEEIIDPIIKGNCDVVKMEILVRVALQCVEEDKDARPTMRRVMEMLLECKE